jgi:hypothetical protein
MVTVRLGLLGRPLPLRIVGDMADALTSKLSAA